jgi:hypothetical protein
LNASTRLGVLGESVRRELKRVDLRVGNDCGVTGAAIGENCERSLDLEGDRRDFLGVEAIEGWKWRWELGFGGGMREQAPMGEVGEMGASEYIGKMAPNYDAFSPFEHFFGPAFWGSLVSGGPILYVM